MKTILITGVNGFVGTHLAAEFARRGWRVVGTASSAAGAAITTAGVARKSVLQLGDPAAGEIFAGVDTVVHCAYDLRPQHMEQNVSGTRRIAAAAAAAGVARQVFVGSYSGHATAVTGYGRSKFILQEFFLARGDAVVRPGLVIGAGGIFRRLARTAKLPIVPLPDGGRDKTPVVAVADFQTALAAVVEGRRAGLFNLFNPEQVTMKELIAAVRRASGRRALLLPVPSAVLLAVARSMETFGLAPPFDTANFTALRANQGLHDASHLGEFIPQPLTLAEMVDAACRAMRVGKLK
jgi:nucleoside-diphosphate-sugar epimerase